MIKSVAPGRSLAANRQAVLAVRRLWSASGGSAPVDTERRTGDERGTFEVENPVDHVADLAHAPKGCRSASSRYEAGS